MQYKKKRKQQGQKTNANYLKIFMNRLFKKKYEQILKKKITCKQYKLKLYKL